MSTYESSQPAVLLPGYINASLQELLMLEMTALAHRLTTSQVNRRLPDDDTLQSTTATTTTTTTTPEPSAETHITPDDDDLSAAELLESKLESLGYRVGHGLVERFSRDRAIFADSLDIIKFVCKDLWILLFNKQIDNLKTNHRGVYVLTDNTFKWFLKMSWNPQVRAAGNGKEYAPYLWFPCGIIRGALGNLGMDAVVIAECPNGPPGVTFQIKTIVKEQQ